MMNVVLKKVAIRGAEALGIGLVSGIGYMVGALLVDKVHRTYVARRTTVRQMVETLNNSKK